MRIDNLELDEPLDPYPSPWDLDEQAMAAEDRYLRTLGADR